MPRWITRGVAAQDGAAFAHFERSNRDAFEWFNEPHKHAHYSGAGLRQAFDTRLAQHRRGHRLTRVVTTDRDAPWLGMGSLTVHHTGPQSHAVIVYQSDSRYWRHGVGGALMADLIHEAHARGLDRLEAQITCDNLVSLHLLRRAGFRAQGWAQPAALRRGTVECLLLGRVVGTALTGTHMHPTA